LSERREVLPLQFETEYPGIEGDRTLDVADLISNAPESEDEAIFAGRIGHASSLLLSLVITLSLELHQGDFTAAGQLSWTASSVVTFDRLRSVAGDLSSLRSARRDDKKLRSARRDDTNLRSARRDDRELTGRHQL
jgi:hypothetical protein